MSIRSRIVDAAGTIVRSAADRVLGPPPPEPLNAEPVSFTAYELSQPERMAHGQQTDLLERVAPGPLAHGVQEALSTGMFKNGVSPRKGSGELVQLYRESPWLRATAHKVGSSVAAVEWKIFARKSDAYARDVNAPRDYKLDARYIRMPHAERAAEMKRALSDGDLEEFPLHPFHRLMERPNPNMSGFAARLVTTIHLDLLGEAFWVVEVDDNGAPSRFWPLPSQWVQTIPTTEKPWFEVRFPNYEGVVPADRMLWFRDVDPGDPYGRGAGLGMALADELDIDENAAKTVKGYFENQAIPALLVSLKNARQDVVDRARQKWEKHLKGFKRAYQTFFTGAEINVQRLDTSFKDMMLVDLRKAERDAVIQTWGVPPEKLAIIENSNRSTIDAADLIYAKDVVVPRLELMRLELQRIASRWDARLIVDYVSPVPEDIEQRRAAIQANGDIYTIDEQRSLAGLPPLHDEMGAAFLASPGKVYTRDLSTFAQGTPVYSYHLSAGVLTNNEMRVRLGLGETMEPWGRERTVGFYSPFMGGGGSYSGSSPEAGLPPADADTAEEVVGGDDQVDTDEDPIPDDVDLEVGADQEARARVGRDNQTLAVRAAHRAAVLAKHARKQRAIAKRASALSVKNLRTVLGAVDVNSMAGVLEPQVAALVEAFGQETLDAVESTKRFDMQDPAVQEHIREQLQDRIGRMMNVTTRENIRVAINEWDGDDDEHLVTSVRSVFDTARIERSQAIAETEGQRSREFASHQAMRQSGIVARKEWIAVADSRTREAHLSMDGQMRDLDAPFEVPSGKWAGSKAQAPGSFGIAALDIRCRCQSAPVFDLDEDDSVPEGPDRAARRAALLAAGIVVRGALPNERAALWEAQDKKMRRFEVRLADAATEGFDEQEERVVRALTKVLG